MCVAVVPFRRRQVRPVDAAGDNILTIISHDVEECVISLKNSTIEVPDENSDDVGVDQPPNPELPVRADRNRRCAVVIRQRVEGRDEPLQLILVPRWMSPQAQLQRQVDDAVAAKTGCDGGQMAGDEIMKNIKDEEGDRNIFAAWPTKMVHPVSSSLR